MSIETSLPEVPESPNGVKVAVIGAAIGFGVVFVVKAADRFLQQVFDEQAAKYQRIGYQAGLADGTAAFNNLSKPEPQGTQGL